MDHCPTCLTKIRGHRIAENSQLTSIDSNLNSPPLASSR
jgi:hypothetical protein